MKPLHKGVWKSGKDYNINSDGNNNNRKEVKLVFGTNKYFCICNKLKPSICQQHFLLPDCLRGDIGNQTDSQACSPLEQPR